MQAVPLVIGQFLEMVDQNSGIVGSTTGSNYYVRILSTLNRELLKPSSSVAMHRCARGGSVLLPTDAVPARLDVPCSECDESRAPRRADVVVLVRWRRPCGSGLQAFQCAGGLVTAGGGLVHFAPVPVRAARRHVSGRRPTSAKPIVLYKII